MKWVNNGRSYEAGLKQLNRRRFIASFSALSGALGLPWLVGCSSAEPVQVAIHPWIGYETLNLANEFNWLPRSVQFTVTKDLGASAEAIRTGQVDAACLTLDEVLGLRGAGVPLTVAMVFDVSAGADVVLARTEIDTLPKLAGARIGIEQNALGLLVLSKLLEAAGLPQSEVKVVNCPPDAQLDAWRKKLVDVVVTYEPNATLLQREGAKRIFDSRQIPDTIIDVLAVRLDRISNRGAALRDLTKAHFLGLSHLHKNRQDAMHRIATRQGITFDEVNQTLAGVLLPSLEANREFLAGTDARLTKAARTLSSIMTQKQLLPREDTLDNLVNSTWLPDTDLPQQ